MYCSKSSTLLVGALSVCLDELRRALQAITGAPDTFNLLYVHVYDPEDGDTAVAAELGMEGRWPSCGTLTGEVQWCCVQVLAQQWPDQLL